MKKNMRYEQPEMEIVEFEDYLVCTGLTSNETQEIPDTEIEDFENINL